MQLTEKALKAMQLGADKTLSFGCLISATAKNERRDVGYLKRISWIEKPKDNSLGDCYDIIGHPITRGRLCYLYRSQKEPNTGYMQLLNRFCDNPELYQKTILDRQTNDELMDLIIDFLESLKKNENNV